MSRQGRHTNARARNHDLLDVANHLSRFVKQQQKRTLDQDVKQQWRLTAAKLSSNRWNQNFYPCWQAWQYLRQLQFRAVTHSFLCADRNGTNCSVMYWPRLSRMCRGSVFSPPGQRLQDCQEDLRVHDLSPYAREHSDWTQQDQELLFQISQQFKADSLAPSKDSMHQYMQAMLPGKSIADIAGHATWCWQKCMLDKRSRSLFCAWDKARQTFLEDARKMLSQSVQRQAASAQTAADKLKCLSLQHELHNELKVLRCEKYVQEAMNAIEADAEQQALTAKQEEEARQLHSRLQHNKQQLALYYKAQEAARAEAQAAATLQAEEEAAQQRTARLDRLRAQVQVHVESDPERAMAATAASSAQEASHDPAFAPVNGYTIETLLKDKRFKVLEALRQQSLHNTSYAKQALLAVSPSTIPRRDTLTTSAKD
ncbi:hypothetical protein WJX82_007434 [Trebouxia sp. C0006]